MTGVRTVIPSVQLNRQEFNKRFSTRFFDPLFDRLRPARGKRAPVLQIRILKSPSNGWNPARGSRGKSLAVVLPQETWALGRCVRVARHAIVVTKVGARRLIRTCIACLRVPVRHHECRNVDRYPGEQPRQEPCRRAE